MLKSKERMKKGERKYEWMSQRKRVKKIWMHETKKDNKENMNERKNQREEQREKKWQKMK